MVSFVKNKLKLGLAWAPQGGSPKLFYSFNLVTCFEITRHESEF